MSPGTNDLNAKFLSYSWNTTKHDVMVMLHDFYSSGIINVALNETIIV